MKRLLPRLALVLIGLGLFSVPAVAGPVSSCDAGFTTCSLYEGSLVTYPFCCGISGDVVLLDPVSGNVSDVFRIFNDAFDSGGGTGLGLTALLYSGDEGNLPAPSTYSVNVVKITETAGPFITETDYNGNGTLYRIFSGDVPEPSTFALLALGVLGLAVRVRRRNGAVS